MNGLERFCTTLSLSVTVLALAACGDRVVLLECPLGTMPEGAQCVPYEPDFDSFISPLPDSLQDVAASGEVQELETVGRPDDIDDDGSGTVSDAESSSGGVGAACLKAADCGVGWSCLNWPGGYCTILDCSQSSCPAGSVCTSVSGGNFACLRTCGADTDCPSPEYQACKEEMGTVAGELAKVCYGLAEKAGSIGSECQDPSDCLGPALCEALSPNGYCSIAECTDIGCPEGATCARLQGLYFCLRDCTKSADCFQSAENEQACMELKDVEKQPVKVCSPSEGDKVIGEACVSDVECTSAMCEVLGEGRCSQSNKPCDSESDCEGAEFCSKGPQTKVGYCTGTCSLNSPCQGAGFCALSDDVTTGVCRSTCPAANDPGTCPINDGFSCIYGVPLGEFSGKYLCDVVEPGDVGSPCTEDLDCPFGTCTGGDDGICVKSCSADFGCPFPGTCYKDDSGKTSCRPSCLSGSDCKPGQTCKPALGGLTNACAGP